MNYVNFCWLSAERAETPNHTALPSVEYLKNLAIWAKHLESTFFLPILWVNQAVFNEIIAPDRRHFVNFKDADIQEALPKGWQQSYRDLVKKVDKENVIFWRKRSPNNQHHIFAADINIIVINLEGFFQFSSKYLQVFKTIIEFFEELLKANLFAFIKDHTVDFFLSFLGGFYFDLDFCPNIKEPFFQSMEEIKEKARSHIYSKELISYTTILSFLFPVKNYGLRYRPDIGMKFNLGETADFIEENVPNESLAITEEMRRNFRAETQEYRTLIENNTIEGLLKKLPFEEKIDYFKMYQEESAESFLEKLFVLEGKLFQTKPSLNSSIKNFFKTYKANLDSTLGKKNSCSYSFSGDQRYVGWLNSVYIPFYEKFILNKFHNSYIVTRYAYTGYHYIQERFYAGRVIAKYVRDYNERQKEKGPHNIP